LVFVLPLPVHVSKEHRPSSLSSGAEGTAVVLCG
jgi:hypothetical protein